MDKNKIHFDGTTLNDIGVKEVDVQFVKAELNEKYKIKKKKKRKQTQIHTHTKYRPSIHPKCDNPRCEMRKKKYCIVLKMKKWESKEWREKKSGKTYAGLR